MTLPPASGPGRDTQSAIFLGGASGVVPAVASSPEALASAAQKRMSRAAWAYVAGSAGSENTAAANRAAFDRHRIVPRMLRDVSERDLSINLFGQRLNTPLIAAPIGVLELTHPDGDLAAARACAALGVPFVMSNQSSVPMERTAAEMGDSTRWFQLYWSSSNDLVASLVSRAEASGASAIVVTLDTHQLGWRPRDLDLGHLPFVHGMGLAQYTSDPVFRRIVAERLSAAVAEGDKPKVTPAAVRTLLRMTRRHPGPFLGNLRSGEPRAAVQTFLDVFSRSSLTWEDLAFLREHTSLPIILKGIQHPDDATAAIEAGVDGIIVSNHGGRQIDGAVGSLDALPGVVERVANRIPVLFDSGIRGGSDVLKALALGAKAVLIGRPYVYGLSLAGEAGVDAVMRNIIAEFDITLGLAGYTSASELEPQALASVTQ